MESITFVKQKTKGVKGRHPFTMPAFNGPLHLRSTGAQLVSK